MKKILPFLFVVTAALSYAQPITITRVIYFESGKSDLPADACGWIDSVAGTALAAESYSISIEAYCDADGSDAANMRLSEQRAAGVENRFIAAKAEKAKIQSAHFGESEPVCDNASLSGKAKNRRAFVTVEWQEQQKIVAVNAAALPRMQEQAPAQLTENTELKAGERLVLKNINFEGGSSVLLDESVPTLNLLIKLMKSKRTMKIEIGGHVCCGPDMPLSIARARRVYEYLLNRGVDAARMTYKGYSFDKPIASEETEEGKRMNRRVEITILSL